eukprot:930716-Rhodomonas_salina.1
MCYVKFVLLSDWYLARCGIDWSIVLRRCVPGIPTRYFVRCTVPVVWDSVTPAARTGRVLSVLITSRRAARAEAK